MLARNAAVPAGRPIEFRMGVDIIIEEGDIFGDCVNIAAHLEALAEPGGICISAAAHEQVRDKLDFSVRGHGRAAGQGQINHRSLDKRTFRRKHVNIATETPYLSATAPHAVIDDGGG
jgi:class 3 adenylate cyclase